MSWTAPSFTEINMSAEIGAYQEDGGGQGNQPPALAEVGSGPADHAQISASS